jgi:hypothetical protein
MSHSAWIGAQGLGARVQGFTTTRLHGVSAKPFDSLNLGEHVGDDPDHVAANRQRLNQWLPAPAVWVQQVHGTHVVNASTIIGQPAPEADAIITTEPGQVLGILTADCLPVVMANEEATVLGLAHAGWRGLAAGVLTQTVAAMRARQPVLGPWRAWIGPCISAQAFEVGDDVRDAFFRVEPTWVSHFTTDDAPHKWRCDLPAIAQAILLGLGAASVQWCGLCTATASDRRFFSYRRDGQTGRMATVAWLR